jgi:predicted nucleic acid-binding protein
VIVLDTSAVVDLLLNTGVAVEVRAMISDAAPPAAPVIVIFEVLTALRRGVFRHALSEERAKAAVDDLGDLRLDVVPSRGLRARAWQLPANMTIGDALFVSLAQWLAEPLVTKDSALARSAASVPGVRVHLLSS